jgi:hypothetical protein
MPPSPPCFCGQLWKCCPAPAPTQRSRGTSTCLLETSQVTSHTYCACSGLQGLPAVHGAQQQQQHDKDHRLSDQQACNNRACVVPSRCMQRSLGRLCTNTVSEAYIRCSRQAAARHVPPPGRRRQGGGQPGAAAAHHDRCTRPRACARAPARLRLGPQGAGQACEARTVRRPGCIGPSDHIAFGRCGCAVVHWLAPASKESCKNSVELHITCAHAGLQMKP